MGVRGVVWGGMRVRWRTLDAMALALALGVSSAACQAPRPSEQFAHRAIERWPVPRLAAPVDQAGFGLLLQAMDEEWQGTADPDYFNYARAAADALIAAEDAQGDRAGALRPWLGPEVLMLYRVTQDERYWELAAALHQRLRSQRQSGAGTSEESGSLEERAKSLYETEPFLAEYARVFQQPADFSAITERLLRAGREARKAPASQRARAWLLAALVDALPAYPRTDSGRPTLLAMLRGAARGAPRLRRGRHCGAAQVRPMTWRMA